MNINFSLWIFYSFLYFFFIAFCIVIYEFRYLMSPRRLRFYFDYKYFLTEKKVQNKIISEFISNEIIKYYSFYKEPIDSELIQWVNSLTSDYLYEYLKSDFAINHNKWAYMINDINKIQMEDFLKIMYSKHKSSELSFLDLIGYEHYFQISFVYKHGLLEFSNKLIKIIALAIIFDPALNYKLQSKAFDDFLKI